MPAGFEMLINNFSVGILGMILAIFGYYLIGPLMEAILAILTMGVNVLINHALLPLVAIFVEPAKVLFLNNAINHGIFTPIGIEQASQTGRSIMYMLEANPGPGLGVLLAYWIFSKDQATKDSAPGAIIIHFFGGIHEIYFPYILMNPLLLLAAIAGGAVGILINVIFNSGLVSAASPGSIIAILGMCHPSSYLGVILSVVLATLVSMLIASFILKVSKNKDEDIEKAQDKMNEMKTNIKNEEKEIKLNQLRKIVFACDAGMGSSAMGATILTKKLKEAGIEIDVPHYAINDIPEDTEVVVTHQSLVNRVKDNLPNVVVFPITNFMGGAEYDEIVEKLK